MSPRTKLRSRAPQRGGCDRSSHIAASALPTEQSAQLIAAAGQAYTDALGIGPTLAAASSQESSSLQLETDRQLALEQAPKVAVRASVRRATRSSAPPELLHA
jgi:hypothetical protein